MEKCLYYQAQVEKKLCWMVTSSLRLTEHVVFDRCFDKEKSIFEFFVAPGLENVFLDIMKKLEARNVISQLEKKENRLVQKEAV